MSLLLNYILDVEVASAPPSVSFAFLDKICVVAKPKADSEEGIREIFTPEEIADFTDNTSVVTAFNSGASSIFLITKSTLDISTEVNSDINSFYTVLITEDFDTTELANLNVGLFEGVVGYASSDIATVSDFATTSGCCGFYDGLGISVGMIHAFVSMFKQHTGRIWLNQQYIDAGNNVDNIGAVQTLGEAENLFNSRVSFYLKDDTNLGTKLGFFSAGGKGITAPYVQKQLELSLQNRAFAYISQYNPKNTPSNRGVVASLCRTEGRLWIDDGMLNNFDIEVLEASGELFKADLRAELSISTPLWRLKLLAQEVENG